MDQSHLFFDRHVDAEPQQSMRLAATDFHQCPLPSGRGLDGGDQLATTVSITVLVQKLHRSKLLECDDAEPGGEEEGDSPASVPSGGRARWSVSSADFSGTASSSTA